ncbi:MAG: hypothetical protein KJO98_15470, partial [Rhodothermia bacterium]|nr:hypothetical protein [Rhodothermia bacterium]
MSDFAGVVSLNGQPIEPEWENALLTPFHGRLHATHRDATVLLLQVEGADDFQSESAIRPVVSSSLEGLRIVADLRVDQMDAREELSGGRRDEEKVLALFANDRNSFPTRITGDFAAVIWDDSQKALVGVRDHFGVHPFYYVWHDGLLFFSSDIRSLTGIGPRCRELDPIRVAQFLEGEPTEEDRTFYSAIKRLPRASRLDASKDGLSIKQYWSPGDIPVEVVAGSEANLVHRFRDVFGEAVSSRVGPDGVIGTLLSGGLDSSSITCTAREVMDPARPLLALSAVFPGLAEPYRAQIDESMYVDAVCEIDGISSVRLEADRLTPLSGLKELLSIHGQPIDPPNAYLDFAMCKLAAENGVEVLLDGLEGDITISHGIHFLDELAHRGEWSRLLREGERLDQRLGLHRDAVFRRYGLEHLALVNRLKFLKGLATLILFGRFRIAARAGKSRLTVRAPSKQLDRRTLISKEFAAQLDWASRSNASGPQSYV